MKNDSIGKYYMNMDTGNVDTLDGWYPFNLENSELVEVVRDGGEWASANWIKNRDEKNDKDITND